jgi:hypothetical protein
MTDARDGGAIPELQADGNSRAGFYDEMNEMMIEAQEHESGQNSDGNLSSHSHVYSPEVSTYLQYCAIYISL